VQKRAGSREQGTGSRKHETRNTEHEAGYAWLVNRIEEYQMRATTYGALVLLALVVVGLPLGMAEILMRWRHRPVRLKVDWPMLLTYGLPGLMLAEIALIWLWVRLPPGLSAMALALGEQEPIATAAGGFLIGIAVARAVRLEAKWPSSPA
jgi:hypothetical protein